MLPGRKKSFRVNSLPSSIKQWFKKAHELGYGIHEAAHFYVIYGEERYQALREFVSFSVVEPPCNPYNLDGECPLSCNPNTDLDCCKESLGGCSYPLILNGACVCGSAPITPPSPLLTGSGILQASLCHFRIPT